MASDPRPPFETLSELRDNTIMLVLGNAYFCEEPFLKKIGLSIDSHVQKLRGDILTLKKEFPGKFVHEVNTDDILEAIQDLARQLQNPDQSLNERCTVGELGQELGGHVDTLTGAVKSIKDQIYGKTPAYTKTESIANVFGPLQGTGTLLAGLLRFITKALIILVLLSILPFTYLFLTIETENSLSKELAQHEAFIKSQQEILSGWASEKERIAKEIDKARESAKDRQDKIGILDLNMGLHKVDEEVRKLEIAIHIREKKIKDSRKKIDGMKRTSFLKRLLRF